MENDNSLLRLASIEILGNILKNENVCILSAIPPKSS